MKKLWWEECPMTGEVLVTFKGKPLITTDMLDRKIEEVLKTDWIYAWTYTEMDPKRWARDMLRHMIAEKIREEYIAEHNIKPTDDPMFYYHALMGGKPEASEMEIQALYDKRIAQGKYDHPLEEIRSILEKEIIRKKRNEAYVKILPELMKKYEVVVNEDYFKSDGDVDIYDKE